MTIDKAVELGDKLTKLSRELRDFKISEARKCADKMAREDTGIGCGIGEEPILRGPAYFTPTGHGHMEANLNVVVENVSNGTIVFGRLFPVATFFEHALFYLRSAHADIPSEKFYVFKRRGHVLLIHRVLDDKEYLVRIAVDSDPGVI